MMELDQLDPGTLGQAPTASSSAAGPLVRPATGPTGPSAVDFCPGTGNPFGSGLARGKLEPLSASSYRVEFTASAELYAKLERARELSSHTLPGGELATVIERALDALIEKELRRRTGAGKPRKQRALKLGSRHVPLEVARQVWERDGGQCTFVDAEGRRCSERRYLTLEHRHPYALGGPPTVENICLLCANHNAHSARQVFGKQYIEKKRAEREISPEPTRSSEPSISTKPKSLAAAEGLSCEKSEPCSSTKTSTAPDHVDLYAKLLPILCNLGFRKRQVVIALSELRTRRLEPALEPLLREALRSSCPEPSRAS